MAYASDYFLNEVLILEAINDTNDLIEHFCKLPQTNQLQLKLNYHFKTKSNLFNVFCHKSFSHEAKWEIPNNERLEFLGDSVLQLVVSEKLILDYPDRKEGDLSKLRSSIVNAKTLSKLAKMLKLDQLILLGKGEFKEKGHLKESLLSDAFEALLGAIYLESGMHECQKIIINMFSDYLKSSGTNLLSDDVLLEFDAKSRLQEAVMQLYKQNPIYESVELKKNKKTYFKVSLKINEKIINTITHESKKKAMQLLATDAIKNNRFTR